jgi:hypothetical protein
MIMSSRLRQVEARAVPDAMGAIVGPQLAPRSWRTNSGGIMAHSHALRHSGLSREVRDRPAQAAADMRDTSPWFFLTFGPASLMMTVILVAWLSRMSF